MSETENRQQQRQNSLHAKDDKNEAQNNEHTEEIKQFTQSVTNNFNPISHTIGEKRLSLEQYLRKIQHKLKEDLILIQESSYNEEEKFERELIQKLSESAHYDLEETYRQIEELEQKLENPILTSEVKQELKQEILQQRMNQLAFTKVLVNTYKCHEYRLVIGRFHIAAAYQELECHEQAIEHLALAIDINQKFLEEESTSFLTAEYQGMLLTALSQSLFKLGDAQKSLDQLNKALQLQEVISSKNGSINDFWTVNLICEVLLSVKQMEEAMMYGKIGLESAEKNYGSDSVEMAKAYKMIAEVECEAEKYSDSLEHLARAISILKIYAPEKESTIIEYCSRTVEIKAKQLKAQNASDFEPYFQLLREKYSVMEDAFGYRDKRCIKQKRFFASVLLKHSQVADAEEELEDILEIEETVYGEKSVEVAKTLKLLGTVAMSQNQLKKAQNYLSKSKKLFHDQGLTNLQREVQSKLYVLKEEQDFNKPTKF